MIILSLLCPESATVISHICTGQVHILHRKKEKEDKKEEKMEEKRKRGLKDVYSRDGPKILFFV